jgi:hypothetical protein
MDFNDVGGEGGWGQKVLYRPLADSFAVGRRQKEGPSTLSTETLKSKKNHRKKAEKGQKS